jgi:hypothetical protein
MFIKTILSESYNCKCYHTLNEVIWRLTSLLPKLVGVNKVLGLGGKIWSPRKALRRALWHERDHTEHIRKLIA